MPIEYSVNEFRTLMLRLNATRSVAVAKNASRIPKTEPPKMPRLE